MKFKTIFNGLLFGLSLVITLPAHALSCRNNCSLDYVNCVANLCRASDDSRACQSRCERERQSCEDRCDTQKNSLQQPDNKNVLGVPTKVNNGTIK